MHNAASFTPTAERVNETRQHTDTTSDAELIAAINAGDSDAFEVLYWRYREWVLALACRFTGDPDVAPDILQETFLYVLRKFPGFRLTSQFKTFLYPAVRNLSIAARRKTDRYAQGESAAAALQEAAAPEAKASGREDLQTVLVSLPETQREVLLLRFVDDLRLEEIADALGIPLGTVKSRLHNALQTLRADERTRRLFE